MPPSVGLLDLPNEVLDHLPIDRCDLPAVLRVNRLLNKLLTKALYETFEMDDCFDPLEDVICDGHIQKVLHLARTIRARPDLGRMVRDFAMR